MQRLAMRRRHQADERGLIAGTDDVEHAARAYCGTGQGPPISVHGEGLNAPGTPPSAMKRIPFSPGTMRRRCSGPTRTINPGTQLKALLARPQLRRTLQRDVDLLLVGILHGGVVRVVGIALPARRQREQLHPPRRHSQRRARPARDAVIDRLHLVERGERDIGHRASNPSGLTLQLS